MIKHIRVHGDNGRWVRTFCRKVALRSQTRPFRRSRYAGELLPISSTVGNCLNCERFAQSIVNHEIVTRMAPKPVTVRRYSVWLKLFSSVLIDEGPQSAMKLLEAAQAEAERIGDEINAKHKRAEKAVRDTAAAVARWQRKLKATKTFLTKAEKRHASAVKKLAKTPKYEPPQEKEGNDDAAGHPGDDSLSAGDRQGNADRGAGSAVVPGMGAESDRAVAGLDA
jgi:hypothetical protein